MGVRFKLTMAKAALGPAAFLVAFLVLSQGNFVMATSGTEGTDVTTTTEAATTTVAATTTAMLATTTAVATTTEAAGTETDATAGTGGETTTQIVRPVIQSIDPVQGADGWQTEITISGVTFSSTGTSATIGGQECLNLTSTSTTISCTTSQNTGKNLVVQVTVNGISSDSVDKTFSFFKGSSPIKFTLSGNIASFVRRDFQIKMQQLLALALADQVYFLSVRAGSVIAEFMLLASPTQPNADTAAVATLKQKAANGELGSVFPGASVEVGGETVSVCESNCGSSDSDEDDGLKGWEIALIVIGVLLGVGLIGAAGFFMYRKNQQNGVGEDLAHRPLTDAPFQKAMAQHATLYKTNEFAMV